MLHRDLVSPRVAPTSATAGAAVPQAAGGMHTRAAGLVAVWCSSVGSTWTVELREPDPHTTLGTLVDWISSGVPTSHPEPDEAMVRELLAARGLYLYPDLTACPCTASRHSIGYVGSAPRDPLDLPRTARGCVG